MIEEMKENLDDRVDQPELVLKRLEKFAKAKIGSLSAMGVDMGKSPSYFAAYKSAKKMLGGKLLIELKEKYGLNPDYLKRGAQPELIKELYSNQTMNPDRLITRKRDVMKYNLVLRDDYERHDWDAWCKDMGIDSEQDTLYEIVDTYSDTRTWLTDFQFFSWFEQLR